MFNLFEYLDDVKERVQAAEIYKASGITRMEELLQNLRNLPGTVVVARDSGDGYLNLNDRRLDQGYQMFYVFARANFGDHAKVLAAKRAAMAKAIQILDVMKADSTDFGDPTYGMNFSRIDYNELGPVAGQYYGYSFGFLVEQSI